VPAAQSLKKMIFKPIYEKPLKKGDIEKLHYDLRATAVWGWESKPALK